MKTNEREQSPKAGRIQSRTRWMTALGMALAAALHFLGIETALMQPAPVRSTSTEGRKRPAPADLWNDLSRLRSGRIVLHTMCLIRRPENARWHWRGILREVGGGTPR